jgi:acylphosphatase
MSVSSNAVDSKGPARLHLVVSGLVQRVGFRPFVSRLAREIGVAGHALNQAGDVEVEVEGSRALLDVFLERLEREAPRLSAVEEVRIASRPERGETGFRILESESRAPLAPVISPDVATCDDCLLELFDRADRRDRYPFINCTARGPRLTIVEGRRTIENARPCARSSSVRSVAPNTKAPLAVAFMRNPTPARRAARAFSSSSEHFGSRAKQRSTARSNAVIWTRTSCCTRSSASILPTAGCLMIENVGNVVCPALFDLGENARVVICSVREETRA